MSKNITQTLDTLDNVEEIFMLLAEFYKYPTEEFYHEINNGMIDVKLKELFQQAGYNHPNIFFKGNFNSFNNMLDSYLHSFCGVSQPFALPVESIYKVWTTDKTANIPLANQKGYLFGDSALHMQYLFNQYGLEIPREYANKPDHLTLLLEFLAFLIRNNAVKEEKQFLSDHFDWLEDFRNHLSDLIIGPFYLDVTAFLINTIANEVKRVSLGVELSERG